MTGFVAPALDGRDPLGFLAAAGTLRLLSDHVDQSAALGFDEVSGRARLAADSLRDLGDCIAAVQTVFDRLGDAVVPGMPADFPPPGAAPDHLRVAPSEMAELVTARGWRDRASSPRLAYKWIRALVTDLAVDQQGRSAITRFAAPSGRQSFSTMFTGTKDAVAQRSTALREAFTGWRRVAGYTGEYLDHRVLMSGADAPSKADVAERGVPGAAWLALMALPLFPATAAPVGRERAVAGWQRRGREHVWCWPLWRGMLRARQVEVLINHPGLQLRARPGGSASSADAAEYALSDAGAAALQRLGVFAACAAGRQRIPGRKSDGVLVHRATIPLQRR